MSDMTRSGVAHRPNRLTWWHLILLVPYVAVLWVPFYNRTDPVLFGFPFFYIYQMAWVVLTAVLTAIVHALTRSRR